jgi:hypothetical protein
VNFDAWLAERAAERRAAGLERRLVERPSGSMVDLAGNDYLGFAQEPRVVKAASSAAEAWGAGAGASRLVTGTLPVHEALETALTEWTGRPAAVALSTGYHANLAAITALTDEDTLIVSDAHVHASLIDACRLSRGTVQVVRHNDVGAVSKRTAQLADRFGPEERRIAIEDDHRAGEADKGVLRRLDSICRAALLSLGEDLDVGIGALRGASHLVHTWADDHADLADRGALGRVQHMNEHRRAGDGMHHLRDVGFHPGALAGGKDDGENRILRHASSIKDRRLAGSTSRGRIEDTWPPSAPSLMESRGESHNGR